MERNRAVWTGNAGGKRSICGVLSSDTGVFHSLLYGRSEPYAAFDFQHFWHGIVCAGAGNGQIYHGTPGDSGGNTSGGVGQQKLPHVCGGRRCGSQRVPADDGR